MKKAWVFLIALALLALSVPVFADGPTVTFSMPAFWWANVDPSITATGAVNTINGGAERVWPTMDVKFDANNTLEVGLRLTNGGQQGLTVVPGANIDQIAGSLWHFMWTSDLTKAANMGDLPVDVKLSIGLMDSVLTNWWYDNNGWEWEYGADGATPGSNWDAMLVTINGDSNFMGWSWAVGVGPLTFHLVNDLHFQNTLLGVEGAAGGLGVFVAYGVYNEAASNFGTDFSKGHLAIEAKYAVPEMSGFTLTPSAFFRYGMAAPNPWVIGVDVTVAYQILKVIPGITFDDMKSPDHISITGILKPIDPAQIWVGVYLDQKSTNSLQAVDIGASYKFGAFTLIVGWVVGGTDQTNDNTGLKTLQNNAGNNVTLGNDNVGAVRNGLYIGSGITL